MSTRKMTLAAFFIAVAIVLTRFFSTYILARALRFDLGMVIVMYSSIALGPLGGLVVGIIADVVGALMFPVDAFYFGFTVNSALVGLIPGLLFLIYHKTKKSKLWQLSVPGFIGIITLITILVLGLNLDKQISSTPIIIITWQLWLTLSLIMACLTIGLTLLTFHFHRKRHNNHFAFATVTCYLVAIIVQIIITPFWIEQITKTPYFVSLLVRVVLILPYTIIPSLLLAGLMHIRVESL